jgi:hypothetical protein
LPLPGDLGPQIASETPWNDVQEMFSYQDAGTQRQPDNTGIFSMFRGMFGGGQPAAAQPPQYGNRAPQYGYGAPQYGTGTEYRDPNGTAPAPSRATANDPNMDHLNSR